MERGGAAGRHGSVEGRINSGKSRGGGSSSSPSGVRTRKSGRLQGLKRLSRNHDRPTSTASSSNGRYVLALYDYIPQKDDELRLVRGRDVEVLSKDKRDCGDKNWWMGRSGHQCGIFPSSFVVEKTSLDRVNILLPLEIDFEELTQKAFIGRGGFGKVFLCAWRGEEVNIATTVTIYEQVCPKLTWKQAASPSMVAPWQTDSYPRVQWFKRIFQVALMCTSM